MKKLIISAACILCAAAVVYAINSKRPASDRAEGAKTEEIMKKMDSGLQYIILTEAPANAQKPTPGALVTVHYSGFLENGKKFDSSVDRGQPFVFNIGMGHVIQGWDIGVMDMKVGEKRRLIIPAHLGYGKHGVPGVIPGDATLIFEVELLKIQ